MAASTNEECGGSEERMAPWHTRWAAGRTTFHMEDPHPVLLRRHVAMGWAPGARLLLPLCGKSRDLRYLAEAGYDVTGVDGVESARESFAAEQAGRVAGSSVVFVDTTVRFVVDDFLAVTAEQLGGHVAGAFDRGGLVAVAPEDRAAYAAVLSAVVSPGGGVLLVAVEHPPFSGGKLGPPFSLPESEVHALFDASFQVELLEREDRMPIEEVWKVSMRYYGTVRTVFTTAGTWQCFRCQCAHPHQRVSVLNVATITPPRPATATATSTATQDRGCDRFDETTYLLKRR